MAKQSSVQITCKVDGDGVDARFEPPAEVNAAAPAGGPIEVTLTAGQTQVFIPAGAKGMIISPGGAAPAVDLLLSNTFYLDPTRSSYLAFLPFPASAPPFITLGSIAGGTILVQWT